MTSCSSFNFVLGSEPELWCNYRCHNRQFCIQEHFSQTRALKFTGLSESTCIIGRKSCTSGAQTSFPASDWKTLAVVVVMSPSDHLFINNITTIWLVEETFPAQLMWHFHNCIKVTKTTRCSKRDWRGDCTGAPNWTGVELQLQLHVTTNYPP